MKQLSILFIYILLSKFAFSQNTLSGKVTGKDNTPLEGALVYIHDLKTGALVHADGMYTIKYLPKGTFLVEAHIVGYADKVFSVTINGATTQDFALETSAIEEQEVVITGNSRATNIEQSPQPTTEVDNAYLAEHSSTNVIDAIATTPGVSAMTNGQSIAKPIIRGLGYNRVLTINDGVEQVDQPWFDEFGIEADPFAVDRYEILKGPGSLAYGSDAIAGVVNLIPEQPLPEGEIKGEIMSNYQTNNGLIGDMFKIGGTNGGISWSAMADYTLAHAYQDPLDGYALNTQFNNFNVGGTVGIHRKWGYSQVHASYFNMTTGILDGTRDSATGALVRQVSYPDLNGGAPSYEIPTLQELKTYTPFCINQRIRHTKVVWDNSLAVGPGHITAIFSYQLNQHQESNDPTQPNTPDIYYHSEAMTYDLRYVSKNYNGFDFSAGINGLYQSSESLGTLLLIPNYNIFSAGAFAIANYHHKILTLSGGLRFDDRYFKGGDQWVDSTTQVPVAPTAPNAFHEFVPFTTNFQGLSASLGATLDFKNNLYVKLNAAKGFRAPNVAECDANGVHDGTVVWELGNHNLKPETNYEEDLAFGYNGKDVNFEIDLFDNYIANFIYAKGLQSQIPGGGDSIRNTFLAVFGVGAPVYQYEQGPCNLYGGEFVLDIHPHTAPWIDLYGTISVVQGGLLGLSGALDSIRYLPFVPPARFTADLRFNLNQFVKNNPMDKVIKNTYVKFGMVSSLAQTQVYLQSADYIGLNTPTTSYENTAARTATAGWTTFSTGCGGDIQGKGGHTIAKIYFVVNNLFNTTYMDYMNRFKYYPVNYTTDRVGVFNMGRNCSFKVDIPIDFKKG